MVNERKWADLRARNLSLPGIDPGTAPAAQSGLPPQKPCDIGLFSDDAQQVDLVDYIRAKR